MNEAGFTHFDEEGNVIMVDVAMKETTDRIAIAKGKISMSREAFLAVRDGTAKKGDVLATARLAGIMAAKRTWEIIPLCHPLMLDQCTVGFWLDEENCEINAECMVTLSGKTGVEMEALTGVSAALLTVYDMCKAIDRGMEIKDIHLAKKSGGKSGEYIHEDEKK